MFLLPTLWLPKTCGTKWFRKYDTSADSVGFNKLTNINDQSTLFQFHFNVIFLDQRIQTRKHTFIKMETILRSSISRIKREAINSVLSPNKFCADYSEHVKYTGSRLQCVKSAKTNFLILPSMILAQRNLFVVSRCSL